MDVSQKHPAERKKPNKKYILYESLKMKENASMVIHIEEVAQRGEGIE